MQLAAVAGRPAIEVFQGFEVCALLERSMDYRTLGNAPIGMHQYVFFASGAIDGHMHSAQLRRRRSAVAEAQLGYAWLLALLWAELRREQDARLGKRLDDSDQRRLKAGLWTQFAADAVDELERNLLLGLVRKLLEEHENYHAGDRDVEPDGERQACDSAVHRKPASQREKERRQDHRQRDDGKDYVAG